MLAKFSGIESERARSKFYRKRKKIVLCSPTENKASARN